MNQNDTQTAQSAAARRRRKKWVAGIVLLAIIAAAGGRRFAKSHAVDHGPLFEVREGPLTISVSAAGTVQSRHTATVRSRVEGRNTITWIIDEGVTVTNGQQLLQLDDSTFVDRQTDQQILVGNAESALIAAEERLAIANIELRSSVEAAELKLHLAELEQEKYRKGEFPQTLQEQESRIAMAHEEVERAKENLGWTRRLADEGYLTRSELQADEMALKQKNISLDAAVTSLNVLTNFSSRQQLATLDSNLRQANMELERVKRQTHADVVQAESNLKARELELTRQRERLDKLAEQVRNCRIVAPTNGVVIYNSTMQASQRRWGGDPLLAGGTVVERQELIHIPVNGGMKAEFSVPESSLNKLQIGQAASIKVDAMPGREFLGRLSKIGILPDGRSAWLNPDLQLYNCEIDLDTAEDLRAGMNCEIDMRIAEYEQAFFVPIQCVILVGSDPVVYVAEKDGAVKRPVKLGLDNNRMVHVLGGLSNGEMVLLNPPLEAGAIPGNKASSKASNGVSAAASVTNRTENATVEAPAAVSTGADNFGELGIPAPEEGGNGASRRDVRPRGERSRSGKKRDGQAPGTTSPAPAPAAGNADA